MQLFQTAENTEEAQRATASFPVSGGLPCDLRGDTGTRGPGRFSAALIIITGSNGFCGINRFTTAENPEEAQRAAESFPVSGGFPCDLRRDTGARGPARFSAALRAFSAVSAVCRHAEPQNPSEPKTFGRDSGTVADCKLRPTFRPYHLAWKSPAKKRCYG